MKLTDVSESNWKAEVLDSEKPVLIDFAADWCGPCRMMHPILEQAADTLADEVTIGQVNVDHNPDLAGAYRISSIPALRLFKNGEVVAAWTGARSSSQLLSEVRAALSS